MKEGVNEACSKENRIDNPIEVHESLAPVQRASRSEQRSAGFDLKPGSVGLAEIRPLIYCISVVQRVPKRVYKAFGVRGPMTRHWSTFEFGYISHSLSKVRNLALHPHARMGAAHKMDRPGNRIHRII
jgi:hypothetical protein